MHDFQGYFSTLISRTFQDQSDFPGLSGSWNFEEKNQGLSRRRGNPEKNTQVKKHSGQDNFQPVTGGN